MSALFAMKAKRDSHDIHGMSKVLNACISRFPVRIPANVTDDSGPS
jgi:hypothetical protein